MRIRGYDEETEELTDDYANLSGVIANLTKTASTPGGISLFTDETKETYRSTYDILSDISEIWDEISDKNQAKLLEKLFGKTRANQGAAILSNFSQAEEAIKTMETASGSADKEMENIQDSIDYALNEFKQTWIGFAQELIERGDITDMLNDLTEASEGLIDTVKTLKPVLSVLFKVLGSGAKVLGNLADTFGGFTPFLVGGGIFGAKNIKNITGSFSNLMTQAQTIQVQANAVKTSLGGMSAISGNGFSFIDPTAINAATTSLKGLNEEQAITILRTSGLDKETQQMILNRGLATGAIVSETSATKLLTAEQATQLVTTELQDTASGKTAESILLQAVAENKLSKETLETLAAQEGEIGTAAQLILERGLVSDATGKVVVTQKAWNVALWENVKAQLAAMATNPATWIVGIIAAVAGLVVFIDKITVSLSEATEAFEEAKSTYDTTTSELSSLEDQVEDTSNQIAELQKLCHNGTITLVEQDQLETLQATNDELERSIKLKKEEQKFAIQDKIQAAEDQISAAYTAVQDETFTSDEGRTHYRYISPMETIESDISDYYNTAIKKKSIDNRISSLLKLQETSELTEAQNKELTKLQLDSEGYASDLDDTEKNITENVKLIQDVVDSYEDYMNLGFTLDDTQQARYDNYKKILDEYDDFYEYLNPTSLEDKFNSVYNTLSDDTIDKLKEYIKSGTLSDVFNTEFSDIATQFEQLGITSSEAVRMIIESIGELDDVVSSQSSYSLEDWLNDTVDSDSDDTWQDKIDDFQTEITDIQEKVEGLGGLLSLDEVDDSTLLEIASAYGVTGDNITEIRKKLLDLLDVDSQTIIDSIDEILDDPNLTNETREAFLELKNEIIDTKDKAVESATAIDNSMSRLSSLKSGITTILDAYDEKKDDDVYHSVGADTLASMYDDLGVKTWTTGQEAWENYKAVAGDSSSTLKELKKAQDDLATSFFNNSGYLDDLTEDNKDYYKSLLTEMGITNADEIVTNKLATQREALALEDKWATTQSKDLTEATYDEVEAFLEEEGASRAAAIAVKQFALEREVALNQDGLDLSDDIDTIIDYVASLTGATYALQQLEKYKNGELSYVPSSDIAAMTKQAKEEIENALSVEVETDTKVHTTKGDKDGDSGSDSDSDDDDDYIDWVQRRVDVLSADIDELASKVENALTVKDKNTFLDQEIAKANELKDTYEGAISVYWQRFQKVAKDKGVNANYLYKIMNGDMSIEDFTGDTRSKYKEAIESAQEWYDLYNEEDKNIIDEEQTILDLEQQQLDTISDQAETRRSQIDDNNSLIEAKQGNAKNVKEEIKLINKLSANSTKNVKTYKDEVDDDNDELRKDTRKLNKILPDSASDGLTDKDIDKIKARIKNGKKIPKKIIDKVTDSDLRVKMTTYNQDVAELQADELDYNIAKEEDETTQYENKIQKKEERRTRKQNLNDRRQDKVDKISERIENGNATEEDFTKYQSIIEKQKVTQSEIIALDEKELALAEEKFGKNSDEYKEIYERLKDDTDQLKEYNKEMLEIPIKKLQQLNEELEEANDIYSKATSYVNYYVGEQIDQTEEYYDSLIEPLQDQLDLLEEVNEERELSINLQKAEYALNRAENQRTNLTLTKDGWVYEADQDAIQEAQEEVDSANYDLTTHRLQDAIDELNEQKEDALDKLNDWLDKFSDACDVFENSQNLKAFEQIFGTSDLSKLGIDETWISSVFEPYSTNLLSQTDATEELTEQGEDIVEAYEDGTITYDEAVEQLSELNVNGYKLDQETLNTLIETIEKAGVNLSTETTLGDDSGTKTTTTEESTEAKAAKKSVQNAVNSYLYTVKNAYGEDSDQYRDASSQFSDSSSSYYYDISDFIDYMKENYGNDSTEYHMAYEMLKTAAKRSNDYDLANASDTGVASTTKASYDSTVISTMSDSIKTLVNKVASDSSDSVTGTIVTSNGKITTAVDVGTGKVDYDAKLLYQQATADASTTAEFREDLDEFLTGSGKKGTTLSGYFNEGTDTLVVSTAAQTNAINGNTSTVVSNLIKSTNSIYSILNNYFNSLDDDDDDSSSGSSKKIKSNAKGTSNAQAGKSLVAEDGAELIWHKSAGTAELVSDTSVVDLDHGDVVYTASQTEDILGRNGATYSPISVNSLGQMGGSSITLPSHATGLNNYGSNLKLSVPSVSNSAFGGTTTLHVDNISLPNVKTQDDAHLIVEALCNLTNETLVTKYRK